jgi:hypothetical protein
MYVTSTTGASVVDEDVTRVDEGVTRVDEGVTRVDEGVTRDDEGVASRMASADKDVVLQNNFARFSFDGTVLTVLFNDIGRDANDDEWECSKRYMRCFYDAALQSHKRFSMIFDMRNLSTLPWNRCLDWANMFQKMRDDSEKCIHRSAVISDSVFLRTTINAFFLMYTTVRPTSFVATMDEAVLFVSEGHEEEA